MSNIEGFIRNHKNALDSYIENFMNQRIEKESLECNSSISELYNVFKTAGVGGKCIRGSLVKLGYELAANHSIGDEILPVSAAYEVFQTAVLAHDDIIDKSPTRRGADSVWMAVSRLSNADSQHYGISQAINLGDIGYLLGDQLIINSSFEPSAKLEALRMFTEVQRITLDGQLLDVFLSQKKDYNDEQAILKIITFKTAWYTIIGPMQLGAVLAKAETKLLNAIQSFGTPLGIAFQLRDDILGITADEKVIGKSNTSDISEGKVTLLANHAFKHANSEQLAELQAIYGHEGASEKERKIVERIFNETGAFAEVNKKAEEYLQQAEKVIPELTNDSNKAELLKQLCSLMLHRKT